MTAVNVPHASTGPAPGFVRALRERRVHLGLSQRELAAELGVTVARVSRHELGHNTVLPRLIDEHAAGLGLRLTAVPVAPGEAAPHTVTVTHHALGADLGPRDLRQYMVVTGGIVILHTVEHPAACDLLPYAIVCWFDELMDGGGPHDAAAPGLYVAHRRGHDILPQIEYLPVDDVLLAEESPEVSG